MWFFIIEITLIFTELNHVLFEVSGFHVSTDTGLQSWKADT
jgi:hypothetical protein